MEGVVDRRDIVRAARNGRRPVAMHGVASRIDRELAARELCMRVRLDAVVLRRDIKSATVYADEATGFVFVVRRNEAVAACFDGKRPVGYFHAVLSAECVFDGGDVIGSAGDNEVVLRTYRMLPIALDGKRPCPVQRQVGLAVQRRIRLVRPFLERIGRPVYKGIRRILLERDEALVRRKDRNRRSVPGTDGGVRKHNLHFVLVSRLHHDSPIGDTAGYNIGSRCAHAHRAVNSRSAQTPYFNGIVRQADIRRVFSVVACIQIARTVREVHARFVGFGLRRRRRLLGHRAVGGILARGRIGSGGASCEQNSRRKEEHHNDGQTEEPTGCDVCRSMAQRIVFAAAGAEMHHH